MSLRHKRALEILQDPEFNNGKKQDNPYFEYKKNEARKNGVNSGSVNTVTESRLVGTGGCSSPNGKKQNIGSMSRIYPNCDQKSGKESSSHAPVSKQPTIYKNNKHGGKNSKPRRIPNSDNISKKNDRRHE
ncbi:13102_t:CDS:2 [Funneliformis mosseae]|uniref:13102_t:CDS:1 n=1 Tax=Funneliformis mosseae TaxID=27381 RepID=A0A9N8VIE6_FUNMO|nr:13102_t:CDS:2 [Funneliformis mosseae]